MRTFDDYKNEVSSEKITLAVLEASKRLIAFSNHSGSVYKLTGFNYPVISSIKDSGVALTSVADLASVVADSYFNDTENATLYIRTSDSANPNGKFLHMTFKLFFASSPTTLPHDLADGFEVYWEPMIASTSEFGVEIDTIDQQNETIEGSGQLTLFNDQEFWPLNFDKLFFENQNCWIYSWSRGLDANEAKLLFKGKVESKAYSAQNVSFKLKDQLAQLRNPLVLPEIQALGLRHSPSLATAKQRLIYGRVFGHRLTNLDAVIDDKYPLPGTIGVTFNSVNVTGSSTQFLKHLNPDDRLVIEGSEYTIAEVTSDTALKLTEVYGEATQSGIVVDLKPERQKRWFNRTWSIAGHALREPTTTVQVGSSTTQLFVESTEDMFDGDFIYIGTLGSGELVTIQSVVNSTQLQLATSLAGYPPVGTPVLRPCIQQVMIDDIPLVFYRDYTVDADSGILQLRDTAELNAAPIRQSQDQAVFTNGSRTVTGTNTNFKSFLKSGDSIRPLGTTTMYEVLYVSSDTSLVLRTPFSDTTRTNYVHYKNLVFDDSEHVLHCEALGRTLDGSTSTRMLRKAPEIVNQLLLDAGFIEASINAESFTASQELTPEDLGFVTPVKFGDTTTVTFRDVINKVNRSVFGILFQDNNFKMSYDVLRPVIPASPIVIRESDVINWSVSSTNKNMISKAIVEYGYREYDQRTKKESTAQVNKTSETAAYILSTSRERKFNSVLTTESDAQRLCDRWKFLLEFSTNSVKIQTKLQLINAEINDVVDFEHRKFYERFAGSSNRKFLAIEKITKSGLGVIIECVDLSNAFNRIALITDASSSWSDSSEETRIHSGFITDENGLIDNQESSFGSSLIW